VDMRVRCHAALYSSHWRTLPSRNWIVTPLRSTEYGSPTDDARETDNYTTLTKMHGQDVVSAAAAAAAATLITQLLLPFLLTMMILLQSLLLNT